jgi:uncharacterized RDD family membrane protein YckC
MMSAKRISAASIDLVIIGLLTISMSAILETRMVLSFAFLLIVLYRFLCHYAWGQTIGKRFFGIRVDLNQHSRSTLRAFAVRDGIYYVPRIIEDIIRIAIAYPAAWAWAVLVLTLVVDMTRMIRSGGSTSFHDNLAKTIVVAVDSNRRVTEQA